MKTLNVLKSVFVAAALLAASTVQQVSAATTYNFTPITNNGNGVNLGQQLQVVVAQIAGGISFTFSNNVGVASSITDIYFSTAVDNLFSAISLNDESAGVDFSPNATPGNLPGGGGIGFTTGYSADSTAPDLMQNGVNNAGEWVSFVATIGDGFSYDVLIDLIVAGGIGIHVQSIGEVGGSDSYVTAVPLPAAAWLFGSALLGFVGWSRRRKV